MRKSIGISYPHRILSSDLMRVTVLGTGAALATGDRVQTGILVERQDPERTLLVDCGSGVLHRLAAVGCAVTDINSVLLTHTHLDHVSDLAGLAKARRMQGESTTRIVGPDGTAADIAPLFQIDDLEGLAQISEFEFQDESTGSESPLSPVSAETIEDLPEGFESVSAVPTVHSRSGAAYRFGERFVFSGDTEASVDLLTYFDGVDVLVHDCARPPGGEPDNHPTPESLAVALEKASPDIDHIYLSHLYPAVDSQAEKARSIVAGATDASVHIASDNGVIIDDI